MKIEIYSKDNCPYCDMAVKQAQQMVQESSNKYVVYKLGVDFELHELLEKVPTARTFPQIFRVHPTFHNFKICLPLIIRRP
jgi:glutaredoxin